MFSAIYVLLLVFGNYIYYRECANLTGNYERIYKEAFNTRQNRLITFDTSGEIKMDLDFNVPFINIPVQKSMNMARTSLLNVNLGSIVVTGVLLFGVAFVLPLAFSFLNQKTLIPAQYQFSERVNGKRSDEWQYFAAINKLLQENNVDPLSCSQRIVCHIVGNACRQVRRGQGSSTDKIVDGLASSVWVQDVILNDYLKNAVIDGLKGQNCSLRYYSCGLTPARIRYLAISFLETLNLT